MSTRAYLPIWNKLKADGEVSITANRLLHPRILKAVKKEKWMDLGYKMAMEPSVAILSHSARHSILTLTLTIKKASDVPDMRVGSKQFKSAKTPFMELLESLLDKPNEHSSKD